MNQRAYPALFIVPKMIEGQDGVHRKAQVPNEDIVTDVVNDALEDEGWSPETSIVDVRQGTRKLQDEYPPEEPIEAEGVTVVFDQTPAPEAEGYGRGPVNTALFSLGNEFDCEVWIDAVCR